MPSGALGAATGASVDATEFFRNASASDAVVLVVDAANLLNDVVVDVVELKVDLLSFSAAFSRYCADGERNGRGVHSGIECLPGSGGVLRSCLSAISSSSSSTNFFKVLEDDDLEERGVSPIPPRVERFHRPAISKPPPDILALANTVDNTMIVRQASEREEYVYDLSDVRVRGT